MPRPFATEREAIAWTLGRLSSLPTSSDSRFLLIGVDVVNNLVTRLAEQLDLVAVVESRT